MEIRFTRLILFSETVHLFITIIYRRYLIIYNIPSGYINNPKNMHFKINCYSLQF